MEGSDAGTSRLVTFFLSMFLKVRRMGGEYVPGRFLLAFRRCLGQLARMGHPAAKTLPMLE